jgi:nifR3 family TIM-barrel protein
MSNFWEKLKKPIMVLAPMCGVTDLPFRLLCHKHGADVVYTEMIMVQALAHKGKKTMELAQVDKKEKPVIIQLGGNEPELFYKSAKIVAEEFSPDGIDINFGCPAKKVAGHGSGVALLRDLNKSYEIIQATIEGAGGLPISIKTRTQIKTQDKSKTVTSLDLIKKIKDLPVAAIMIHGRSFEAPWVEKVDYDYIKEVRQNFKGILIANGGIYEPAKAKEVLKITGADGLGIGHGVYGRPWIFNQIKQYLKTGRYDELSWPQKRKIAVEHAKLAFKLKSEHGLIELRKQLLWYVKGLPNATNYRAGLVQLKTVEEIKQALKNIK